MFLGFKRQTTRCDTRSLECESVVSDMGGLPLRDEESRSLWMRPSREGLEQGVLETRDGIHSGRRGDSKGHEERVAREQENCRLSP